MTEDEKKLDLSAFEPPKFEKTKDPNMKPIFLGEGIDLLLRREDPASRNDRGRRHAKTAANHSAPADVRPRPNDAPVPDH